jgi:hypothetical protein
MATPRKRRPTPLAPIPPAEPVKDNIEGFIEEVTTDLFERLAEAEKIEDKPEPIFREETIVPTDDVGPRFVEVEKPPAVTPAPAPKSATVPQPVPKRHPRNIPKFSRTK